jgi:plasmid stability protein
MNQLTLRNIPDDLERSIRDYSKKSGQSINKAVLELLRKGIGLPQEGNKQRDLSSISGTWSQKEFEEFENNIKVCEQIDEDIWNK